MSTTSLRGWPFPASANGYRVGLIAMVADLTALSSWGPLDSFGEGTSHWFYGTIKTLCKNLTPDG